ncbi:MAG: DUF5668 domain-containing protein [Ignavibacteriales bacterium]|nr:DUF5668 domain-containing protein [Ignavibacteriales bacterium]
MDRQTMSRFPIIGSILVLIGVALLLHQMDIIDIGGWALVWVAIFVYGAANVIRSIVMKERHHIFFGTLCYLSGLLAMLVKFNAVHADPIVFFPAFLIIFGLSFAMLFIFQPSDWHLLIPAFIFCGLGAALMMTELGSWYARDVIHAIGTYWPLLLIVVGVSMLLRKRQLRT